MGKGARWRQAAGLIVMFGAMGALYALAELILSAGKPLTGLHFVGFALVGAFSAWAVIGFGSGYWFAYDATTDRMVLELMRHIRARRISERASRHDPQG